MITKVRSKVMVRDYFVKDKTARARTCEVGPAEARPFLFGRHWTRCISSRLQVHLIKAYEQTTIHRRSRVALYAVCVNTITD